MVSLIGSQLQVIFQLLLAAFLGGVVGLEREYKRKEAGLRTYALVSLGAALFTILSFGIFEKFPGQLGVRPDPIRVVQAVSIGIGFIGAGLIVQREFYIQGLTTAAGLWVVAAVGMAVGIGLYLEAALTVFIAIGILAGLRLVEEKFLGKKSLKKR